MPDSADMRTRIEPLLAGGDVRSAASLIGSLHEESALDAEFAAWVLPLLRSWHSQGFYAEQQRVLQILLQYLPEHCEVLHLLGFCAQAQGDFMLAQDYYGRALKADPSHAFSRLAASQLRMMTTGFAEGRDQYEARFDAVTDGSGPDWRGLPIARWSGECVRGKSVYLWAEQGVGDIVMFAGFLPYLLAQKPKRLVLGMFPKLVTLFARSFADVYVESIDDVIHHALGPSVIHAFEHIERLSAHATVQFSLVPLETAYHYVRQHGLFDFAAPLGDLMVHAMPGFVPAQHNQATLIPEPGRVAATVKRMESKGAGVRIGISWHTTNRQEWMRNIPLEEWLPVLRIPGCHFVSLQHHADADDIGRFCRQHGCQITVDTVDPLADAEGLAALIASMDQVITIDNANAHLAGALGIRTTLLLPKGHNYRWPESKTAYDTYWYKSVEILRQRTLYDWRQVMDEAAARI